MKSAIEQAKHHILTNCLPLVQTHHRKMLIPCLPCDYEDFQKALALPEVQKAIRAKGVEAEAVTVDKNGNPVPRIVIATASDVANGRLDRYLQSLE